jgi:hypothetical protein
VIRGAHQTVTGCSLPPWLPEDTMQIMIDEFSKRLRKIIDNLLYTETSQLEGRVSNGSTCMSVMSFDDSESVGSWAADLVAKK